MRIILCREEALVALIALEKEKKPYGWQQRAVAKFCKALELAHPDKDIRLQEGGMR